MEQLYAENIATVSLSDFTDVLPSHGCAEKQTIPLWAFRASIHRVPYRLTRVITHPRRRKFQRGQQTGVPTMRGFS